MPSFSVLVSGLIILLVQLNHFAQAKTVTHVFEVKYISGAPDGVFREKILGINGQFPGPTIEANFGDILEVFVLNRIQDGQNTSIHWHGIHQKGSHFEDGTSQISQCPLKVGETQMYRFHLEQAGTYWYHSHVNSQYTEGLWGALIIHNTPAEVYRSDADILITLNDWYHRTAHQNEEWHLSPISLGVPPYQDSGMLNALGRYPCPFAQLQNRTCDPALQKRAVFVVQPRKTYRVRVINVSATAAFNFSIDGHRLNTIEVDGIDVAKQANLADIATIGAAQRYSFLVETDKPIGRYLIRATLRKESLMLIEGKNINQYPEALLGDVTGVLAYTAKTAPADPILKISTEPHSYLEKVPPLNLEGLEYVNENDLAPHDGLSAPPKVDQEFVLSVGFFEDHEDVRRGSFNETPFVLPVGTPLLFDFLKGREVPPSAFPLEIDYMNVIQVVINNPFFGPHPFHLHGHHFWVMGTGGWFDGDFDPTRHNLTLTGAKRDTVLVQEQSWAVIRFVADNPGLWTFHCHIDWHNLSGMALTFVEAKDVARRTIKPTEEAARVCSHHHMNLF